VKRSNRRCRLPSIAVVMQELHETVAGTLSNDAVCLPLLERAQRCGVVLSVAVQIIVELMSCSKLHETVAGRVADAAVQLLL